MKNTPIILIALLFTFVGGAAMGYLLAPPRAPVSSAQHNLACSESHSQAGVNSGPPAQSKAPEAVKPRPAASGPESEASPKSLREIVEAFKVTLPPKGNGKITGVVKRPDGSAVPDVRIRAQGQKRYAYGSKRDTDEPGIEEEARRLIDRRKYEELTRVEALTDSAGCFELEGISDIDYFVTGTKRGYLIYGRGSVRPGAHVELRAEVQIELVAEVYGPDGARRNTASIRQARKVTAGEGHDNSGYKMTGPDFYLYLGPGTWQLVAQDPDTPELQSDPVTVELTEGVEPERVALHLIERNTIKGTLTFEGKYSGEYVQVTCQPAPESPQTPGATPPPGRPDRRRDGRSFFFGRNDERTYSFTNLSAGRYELQALVDSKVVASAIVQMTQGVIVQDLVVPAPNRADFVRVTAYGPEGDLLKDLRFGVAYRQNGSSSSRGGSRAILQEDGSYWVAHHPADDSKDKAAGRYFVTVTSDKYGSKEVEYAKTGNAEVTVRFSVPATLKVTILDFAGCAFKGSLRVDLSADSDSRPEFFRNDEERQANGTDGIWNFEALEPGKTKVRLLLSFGESPWDWRVIASQEVTLASGANAASIAIPVLHTLKVRTGEAKAEVQISLRPDDPNARWNPRQKTNAAGEVLFEGLPAGSYLVQRGSERMPVKVPDSLDVLFSPVVFNAMKVTINNENGYGAQVGFMNDDLIISVNGTEFKNERQMKASMEALADEATIKLGVLRNGSTLVIEVEPARFFKREGGADFRPATR